MNQCYGNSADGVRGSRCLFTTAQKSSTLSRSPLLLAHSFLKLWALLMPSSVLRMDSQSFATLARVLQVKVTPTLPSIFRPHWSVQFFSSAATMATPSLPLCTSSIEGMGLLQEVLLMEWPLSGLTVMTCWLCTMRQRRHGSWLCLRIDQC